MSRVSPARKFTRLAASAIVGAVALGAFAAMPAHAAKPSKSVPAASITVTVTDDVLVPDANSLDVESLANSLANSLGANSLANSI